MPKLSVPALLETRIKFFVPFLRSARKRFSGTPHIPNPPTRIVAPSVMRSTATSAFATRLSIQCHSPGGLDARRHQRRSLTGRSVAGVATSARDAKRFRRSAIRMSEKRKDEERWEENFMQGAEVGKKKNRENRVD